MKAKNTFLLITALFLCATMTTTYAAKGGNGNGGGGGGPGGGGDPGGDPTPTGTIYYIGNFPGWSGTPTISMDPDGTNQQVVGSGNSSRIFGNPSWDLHNNHRWFLNYYVIPGEYSPSGDVRTELFALRDDFNSETNNNPQTIVQLTDDNSLEIRGPAWLPGDGSISFKGRRWSSDQPGATLVEGGIYTVDLTFDVDGNVLALAAQPTTPTFPMALHQTGILDLGYYSWDPTGQMIVYTKGSEAGIWVDDLSGPEVKIDRNSGDKPEWSPDGNRIVYGTGGGFVTMKPNGKSKLTILRSNSEWNFYNAFWSPDSNHLVFFGRSKLDGREDLFRINVNNSELTQLTDTPDKWYEKEVTAEYISGWR